MGKAGTHAPACDAAWHLRRAARSVGTDFPRGTSHEPPCASAPAFNLAAFPCAESPGPTPPGRARRPALLAPRHSAPADPTEPRRRCVARVMGLVGQGAHLGIGTTSVDVPAHLG